MSHMSYQHQSLQVLKASFSREMYQVVEETFKMLDTANNMVITKAQMDIAEKVMGFLADDDKGSENQSELIDYNRYLSIILERMNKPFFISSESRDAFQVFDKDGNGFLDAVGALSYVSFSYSLILFYFFTIYNRG